MIKITLTSASIMAITWLVVTWCDGTARSRWIAGWLSWTEGTEWLIRQAGGLVQEVIVKFRAGDLTSAWFWRDVCWIAGEFPRGRIARRENLQDMIAGSYGKSKD
jgi:hypothetical protein